MSARGADRDAIYASGCRSIDSERISRVATRFAVDQGRRVLAALGWVCRSSRGDALCSRPCVV
ncbi:hypothetical protein IID10_19500, partial [candidate division KSB1 bacterium]|nr:hypothetical protein [candidate division KSB1 bacterium]